MASSNSIKDLHGAVGIYFNSVVGSGIIGKVYRAKCGMLPCVAKVFDKSKILPDSKRSRNKIAEFENHCKRLIALRHPSLVQYLGTATGANLEVPFLFMEVLNQNLSQFLEGAGKPLPFHIQLNIGYDVALGLSFLHFNSLVHGSVSSNNVLLIGEGSRAKLSDFGLYKFTSPSDTVSDKNSAFKYLAPEVLSNQNFSSQCDNFSFGVLLIQIITRKAPDPSREFDKSEVKQRQKDINLAASDNQLLPLALNCLKESKSERPTSQNICEEIAAVRKNDLYLQSRETYATSLDEMRQNLASKESMLKEQEEKIHKLEMEHEEEVKAIKESHEKIIETVKSSYEEKPKILESEKTEVEPERLSKIVDQEVVQNEDKDAGTLREEIKLIIEELGAKTTSSSELLWALPAPEAAATPSLPNKTRLEEEQDNLDIHQNKEELEPSKVEASKEETSKLEPSKEDPSKEESSKEDLSKEELSKEELSKEESFKEESSKEELSKEELSKEEPSKEESSKEESSKEEPSKEEPSKEEPFKEESSKEESPKDELSKEEPSKKESSKVELSNMELSEVEPHSPTEPERGPCEADEVGESDSLSSKRSLPEVPPHVQSESPAAELDGKPNVQV